MTNSIKVDIAGRLNWLLDKRARFQIMVATRLYTLNKVERRNKEGVRKGTTRKNYLLAGNCLMSCNSLIVKVSFYYCLPCIHTIYCHLSLISFINELYCKYSLISCYSFLIFVFFPFLCFKFFIKLKN